MFDGLGQAIWGLLIMALWGVAAVAVFIVGAILSIWLPIEPWQVALASVFGGGLICLVFVAVYRP